MINESNQLERYDVVHEMAANYLGLKSSDSEVETLLAGKALLLEKLMQEHSLAEVGMVMVRLDILDQMSLNNPECTECQIGSGCYPFCYSWAAKPSVESESMLEIWLHPNFFE